MGRKIIFSNNIKKLFYILGEPKNFLIYYKFNDFEKLCYKSKAITKEDALIDFENNFWYKNKQFAENVLRKIILETI